MEIEHKSSTRDLLSDLVPNDFSVLVILIANSIRINLDSEKGFISLPVSADFAHLFIQIDIQILYRSYTDLSFRNIILRYVFTILKNSYK